MDNSTTHSVTLSLTNEQEQFVKELFASKNWPWPIQEEEQCNEETEFDPENIDPGYKIDHNSDYDECPHCLCQPCITNDMNRQLWWPTSSALPYAQPHHFNTKERKKCYKKFWTMLFHRDVWRDPRYKQRKAEALGLDPRRNRFEWMHRRDIMPNCVLKCVRQWYPNEPNVDYQGHLWE